MRWARARTRRAKSAAELAEVRTVAVAGHAACCGVHFRVIPAILLHRTACSVASGKMCAFSERFVDDFSVVNSLRA
jgi:hypothetical protein